MDPVRPIEIAIEPKSNSDLQKLHAALAEIAAGDVDLAVSTDIESGQVILAGISEEHLDIKADILRRTYKVEFNMGAPQVAYREKLGRAVRVDYTHKKHIGPSYQFARVIIDFAPGAEGSGFVFEDKIVDGSVPKEFLAGVQKALDISKKNGLLAGFPLIDFKATLIDGAYSDVDSSVVAFQIASQAAFRELKEKGDIKLFEPIMKVEVVTPNEYTGLIIGDLESRRGLIQGQGMLSNDVVINAMVPLANMFGYVSQLRSFSQSRANYTMRFDHYEDVPLPDDDPSFGPAIGMRA